MGGHGHDGICRPWPCCRWRIRRVASKPSICGICTSISTTSKRSCREPGEDLLAVGRQLDGVAPPGENLVDQLLIDQAVFADKDSQRRQIGSSASSRGEAHCLRRARSPARREWHRTTPTASPASSGRRRSPARSACARPSNGRRRSGSGSAYCPGRMAADRVGQIEAARRRAMGVHDHQGERGLARFGRPPAAGSASSRVADGWTSIRQRPGSRPGSSRFVRWPSTTRTRCRPAVAAPSLGSRLAPAGLPAAVKWNVLPRPTSLSTHNRPFIMLDQPPGNGKSQAGAAVFARGRGVGLFEGVEDQGQLVVGNADAGVDRRGNGARPRLPRRLSRSTSTTTSP